MLARRERQVVRGIVVHQVDVGAQSGARVQALEEVVAEQRVLGDPPGERRLERVDVVDALADVAALVEQVLVHVGHRGGVRIEADVAREDLCERRAGRALDADLHARLQHAVAFGDALKPRIEPRAVERMRQGADQAACRLHREVRVGIEGDDVLDCAHDPGIAMNDDKAGVGRAAQEPVELGELAALPLPPHPPAFARVPAALPVKEEEPIGAMSKVEGVDGRQRRAARAPHHRRSSGHPHRQSR